MTPLVQSFVDPDAGSETLRLARRAANGDRDAFAALIEAHYDMIYRTAYKWIGHRSDAEDIAQDVCVKLAGVLKSFDGRSAFTSWLYRITLNTVRDMQRARGRQGRQQSALAQVSAEEAPPEQDDAVAAREIWIKVRDLPEQQRDAVMLVYGEELSHAGAAEVMGCKEATVSWHIHEAKKTLRGLL